MPRWTNGDKARIEYRRTLVGRMNVRGLRLYEIVENLGNQGIVNPDTGQSYDVATISRDISELKKRYREEAAQEIAQHTAWQLAELREARRGAWLVKDLSEVRQNIATEMRLLGTEAPKKQEITGKDGDMILVSIGGISLSDDV